MDVANRLRTLRLLKGLSVNALADRAGLSQSFVREIEKGNKNPTVESIELLCHALELPVVEFFSDLSMQSLLNDEVVQTVYRLSAEQRTLLMSLVKSMLGE